MSWTYLDIAEASYNARMARAVCGDCGRRGGEHASGCPSAPDDEPEQDETEDDEEEAAE